MSIKTITLSETLNQSQLEMISKIESYDLSYVFYRLVNEQKITESDIPELDNEFKKFMVLIGLKIYPIAMISPLIDEVWHQLILFTKKYREFCLDVFGEFINHTPDTPMTPVPLIAGENFNRSYKKYFGAIKPVWFEGMTAETKLFYLSENFTLKPPQMWSGWAGPEA